jgi:hypothetical protein
VIPGGYHIVVNSVEYAVALYCHALKMKAEPSSEISTLGGLKSGYTLSFRALIVVLKRALTSVTGSRMNIKYRVNRLTTTKQ